jgi:predicted amidophosphoribosyltransferase
MTCLACSRGPVAGPRLCERCRAAFIPGGERRLPGGVLVRSAYTHAGTARLLVHRLKYGGHQAAAALLAAAMAAAVPVGATALVPVPRARLRRWRYGVDPAVELARALGRVLALPVLPALAPEWWHRRRAGPAGAERGLPRFRAVRRVPGGAVLVDDVVTTGTTLCAAAAALGGPQAAVTATAALGGTGPCLRGSSGGIVRTSPLPGMPTTGECVPPGTHHYRVRFRSLSDRRPWVAPEDSKGGHGGGSRSR